MNVWTSSLELRTFNLRRSLGRLRSFVEIRWALATHGTNRLLQRRFNRWAKHGRGESMEHHHTRIAETIWERMELSSTDRILDLGCGEGWACRVLAGRAPQGCLVVGLDLSDEMIRRAREKSHSLPNVSYHCGQAHCIPRRENYFSKIISIESFYYFERQDQVLRELLRAMQPGGQLYLLLCLFQEDPQPKAWFDDVALPVHNCSISEYEDMLRRTGWTDVVSQVFDFRMGKRDAHDRPLLLTAKKPC
jgi:ubiquinone/menaquinone biosynthesis C-methylase UbiE